MTLEATAFIAKIEHHVGFTEADKTILKSQANWSQEIASEMADLSIPSWDVMQKWLRF